MDSKKLKKLCFRLTVDIVILIILGCCFLYNKLNGSPTRRGFFCDDESISYPYHSSTVSWGLCLVVGVILPAFVIFFAELVFKFSRSLPWQMLAQNLLLFGLSFGGGAVFEHAFVEIAKFQVGRLRPNFLDVCRPTFAVHGVHVSCANASGSSSVTYSTHVAEFACDEASASARHLETRDAMLSFPSGHSSFIFFCMVFLVGYAQMRLPKRLLSFLLRPFFQVACLWLAWWIALTRISDFKHHWSDVLAGSIIGSVVAAFAVFYAFRWARILRLEANSSLEDRNRDATTSSGCP